MHIYEALHVRVARVHVMERLHHSGLAGIVLDVDSRRDRTLEIVASRESTSNRSAVTIVAIVISSLSNTPRAL